MSMYHLIIEFEQTYKSPFQKKWKHSKGRHVHTTSLHARIKKASTTNSQMHQSIQQGYYCALHKDINPTGLYLVGQGKYLANKTCNDSIFLPSFLAALGKNILHWYIRSCPVEICQCGLRQRVAIFHILETNFLKYCFDTPNVFCT